MTNFQSMIAMTVFLTIVAAAFFIVAYVLKKGSGKVAGPGWSVVAVILGGFALIGAIYDGIHASDVYSKERAAAVQAVAEAEARAAAEEAMRKGAEEAAKVAEEIIAQQQAKEAAAAAKEAEQLEKANWPKLDISENTYEEYRKYLDVAGRGTRRENAHNKAYIAKLNGYTCNDAVYTPLYMDNQYFNELNGIFPVEKYTSLNDIDLQDAAARDAHLEKEHAAQKKAWLALSDDERTEDSDEKLKYDVINDPVVGIELFDACQRDKTWRQAYADYYNRIEELLAWAYESGEGINYFLEYKDEEHTLAGEEQYGGVTEEYFTDLAVPMLEMLSTGFTPHKQLEKRRTSMNMCLPYSLKDNLVRLQPADYQEERTFVTYYHYGKDGKVHKIIGFNIDDRRFAEFARYSKPIEEKGTVEPPKKTKVAVQATVETPPTTETPPETPPNTPPPPEDTPTPPPPNPTPEPECTPDQEPTQDDSGGDRDGGGNKDDEDGGDQDPDKARGEEQKDGEDNRGQNPPPQPETPGDNPGGNPGDGTTHDPGPNPDKPEDRGPQNGNGGNTGGPVNTGVV